MILAAKRKIKFRNIEEEIEILKLQLKARESEIFDLRKEVEELHNSISYRVGRKIAESKIGDLLKNFLKKYVFK